MKKSTFNKVIIIIFCLALTVLSSCTTQNVIKKTYKPETIQSKENFSLMSELLDNSNIETIKMHMKNGDAYIVNKLMKNANSDSITCWGQKVDLNRNVLNYGKLTVDPKQIALIETDRLQPTMNYLGLVGSAIVTLGIGIYCITNPKACFGSCPTFYAWDGEKMKLMAEGFSASILPSLEENDIDALYQARPPSNILEIDLTNEAFETHVIRKANILAVKRNNHTRIIHEENGDFLEVSGFTKPSAVIDSRDSSLELLSEFDGKERFTVTDSTNLAKKETIELQFNTMPSGNPGLVIASRQALVTTFLFYQTLAYMGTKAGEILSSIDSDTSGLRRNILQSNNILGGIDVEIEKDGKWVNVGKIDEKGPIASDVKLIPLPEGIRPPFNVRLKMAQGYIRIDYVTLVAINGKTEPLSIKPSMVYSEGIENSVAYECLTKQDKPLITFPGDKYRLVYSLPDDYPNYELFMDTKGYYLEWMRKEWLGEENPAMVYQYFSNPGEYFRKLAPMYKKIEPVIEEYFWNSRYVK